MTQSVVQQAQLDLYTNLKLRCNIGGADLN